MKGKLPVILAIVLAVMLPMVAPAAGEQVAEREVDQARRVAQDWVNRIAVTDPEVSGWQGAHVTSPQPYHNPGGEVIAYMFAVEKNGKAIGHVLIGSSAYGYPIFAAGKGPSPSIPPRGEVTSMLRKEHGLQIPEGGIGEGTLVLLDILQGFYATWELEGNIVAVNLITGDSFVLPGWHKLRPLISSPSEYKAARRTTSRLLAESLISSGGGARVHNPHKMEGWPIWWCGPSSGVSIGMWQRRADGDVGLHRCAVTMYNQLKVHMGTTAGGITWPWNYGPGFVSYAATNAPPLKHPEHFTWTYRDTYWEIASDIDHGWPLGLLAQVSLPGYPKKKWHWVAIKGYFWSGTSLSITVTDSAYMLCSRCIPNAGCPRCTVCDCPACTRCQCQNICPDPAIPFCPRDWRMLDWDALGGSAGTIAIRIQDAD
jgi:hypothetical protein